MQTPDKSPQLLNIKQLAERLGVSRRTVHYWLINGTLPIAPIPGMKPPKWLASDVETFLKSHSDD